MGMDADAARQRSQEAFVGQTLGTCTLERLLGRGGMGIVYLAQQTRPHRQVAVKLLLLALMPDPERRKRFLERFRREADAVAKLEHPSILPIYEYGEQADLAYLVMPYVGGGTLFDRVVRKGPLPLAEAAGFLAQAATALDYAHARGVIHRDVKPQNMLLYPDKRLVLSDFGIAKVAQEAALEDRDKPLQLTTVGRVVGTPDYIAPEQATGQVVDARADIYSLGVTLFYLVTGRLPFVAVQPMAVAAKHVSELPPSPRQFRPDLPVAAEQVILRALAKNPAARYRSAGEFSHAFSAALAAPAAPVGKPVAARSSAATRSPVAPVVLTPARRVEQQPKPKGAAAAGVGAGRTTAGPRPSRRWLAVLLAILVILLAAGGVYAATHTKKQTPPAATATLARALPSPTTKPSPTAKPSPTTTPDPTPTATPSGTATSTPGLLLQANQFVPLTADLPLGTTAQQPITSKTAQMFQQSNPGRVVDPTTSTFHWLQDIEVTIDDQSGSKYLVVAIDQFSSPPDAQKYFAMVKPHLVQMAQQAFGEEEVDGMCCDSNPSHYQVFFREANVTVLIIVEPTSQQATLDGLSLAKKLDQHVRPLRFSLEMAAFGSADRRQRALSV